MFWMLLWMWENVSLFLTLATIVRLCLQILDSQVAGRKSRCVCFYCWTLRLIWTTSCRNTARVRQDASNYFKKLLFCETKKSLQEISFFKVLWMFHSSPQTSSEDEPSSEQPEGGAGPDQTSVLRNDCVLDKLWHVLFCQCFPATNWSLTITVGKCWTGPKIVWKSIQLVGEIRR